MEKTNFVTMRMVAFLNSTGTEISVEVNTGFYPEFTNISDYEKDYFTKKYVEFVKHVNRLKKDYKISTIDFIVQVHSRPSYLTCKIVKEFRIVPKDGYYASAEAHANCFNFTHARKSPLSKIIKENWLECWKSAVKEFNVIREDYFAEVDRKAKKRIKPLAKTGNIWTRNMNK